MRRRRFGGADRARGRGRGAYMNVKISLKLSRTSSAPWEGTRRVISQRRRFRPFGEFATSGRIRRNFCGATTSATFADSSTIVRFGPGRMPAFRADFTRNGKNETPRGPRFDRETGHSTAIIWGMPLSLYPFEESKMITNTRAI